MQRKGQRIKTCLVYLNDDLEGGETDFPRLKIRFRGHTGEALIFDNVTSAGTGDMNTMHTGLPPTRGEKWLLSQWIRSKPQQVA
jgi:prolyl 4-hydroxylase